MISLCDRLTELKKRNRLTYRSLQMFIELYTNRKIALSYLRELHTNPDADPSLSVLKAVASGYGLSVGQLLNPVLGGGFATCEDCYCTCKGNQ